LGKPRKTIVEPGCHKQKVPGGRRKRVRRKGPQVKAKFIKREKQMDGLQRSNEGNGSCRRAASSLYDEGGGGGKKKEEKKGDAAVK